MEARHAIAAVFALSIALSSASACEVLIDGDLGSVRCTDEGAIGAPACPEGLVCTSGVCSNPSPGSLGAPCSADGDCGEGGVCFIPARYGESGPSTCSRTCCASSDCEPGDSFVCWVPPIGDGSFCRLASETGRGSVGASLAGEQCSGPSDCRSGLCSAELCVDTCCSDTNCASEGARCVASASLSDRTTWSCGAVPASRKAAFEPCKADEDCASNLCAPFAGAMRCAPPCCSSAECDATLEQGLAACTEIEHMGALVRACAAPITDTAKGAVGDPCSDGSTCRSSLCDVSGGGPGYCTDVCCTDESCGDVARFACRPRDEGGAWVLRCALK